MVKNFIITIDTEGDGQWNPDAPCSTENARFIPRFQELAEKYGFKPTWLTNYEMAEDPFYIEYMADCLKRNTCEIGMHLHAWNNPPEYPLKKVNDQRDYLFEYPESIMGEKIRVITEKLENTFSTKMLSHRSGRWSTDETYFKLLKKYGYKYDCSVTPFMNWETCVGSTGKPGSNYSNCPIKPYEIYDGIIEVPVSVRPMKYIATDAMHSIYGIAHELKWCNRIRYAWLRPTKNPSFVALKKVLDTVNEDSNYAMFMLHSSEMMPGGSPSFPDEKSIEELYGCIEKLFAYAKQKGYVGCKLSDYKVED